MDWGRPGMAGEALGHVARTGVTYGTHVFFAALENGQAVDPLGMLPPLAVLRSAFRRPPEPVRPTTCRPGVILLGRNP
jgi:hypothetical protein